MSKYRVHQLGLSSYLNVNTLPAPFTSFQSFCLPHSMSKMGKLVTASAHHTEKPFHRLKGRFKTPKMAVAWLA